MKKVYIDYTVKLIIRFIVMVIALVFSIIFIKSSYGLSQNINVKSTSSSSVNYKTYVEKSEFYKDEYLPEGKFYIASVIDFFNINYKYQNSFTEATDYSYKYNITATLSLLSSSNNVVYTEDFVLKSSDLVENKGNNVSIKDSVNIDYNYYKNIVDKYKSLYLVQVTGDLKVVFNVECNSDVSKDVKSTSVTIPLSTQIVTLKKDVPDEVTVSKDIQTESLYIKNKVFLAIGISLAVFYYGLVVLTIIYLVKNRKKSSKYNNYLRKLLRQYDRIIINLKTSINIQGYMVIETSSFQELLDVRDNLEKPILFEEIQKGQKSLFIVLAENNVAYRYILKDVDL